MSARASGDFLGFPPPHLGDAPVRLPVLAERASWLALEKPPGVAARQHPFDAGMPDLDTALNRQLAEGKPELARRGADVFGSVFYLDAALAGIVLFAKTHAALASMRNAFGSSEFRCGFRFVAAAPDDAARDGRVIEAPLLPHRRKPKMVPSTAKGKKATTTVRPVATAGGWALWEAETRFFRAHQVRAHAALAACPVLGDALYQGPAPPALRDLLPHRKGPGLAEPAFRGVAACLFRVVMPDGGGRGETEVRMQLPKPMRVLCARLGLE